VLTLLFYGFVAIVVVGALFGLAVWLLPHGEQISAPTRDARPWQLPEERPLTPADVVEVRLPVALRGYRFAETDQLLDRLSDELHARDLEIARLRAGRNGLPSQAPSLFKQPGTERTHASYSISSDAPPPAAEAHAEAQGGNGV
jgi:DivIVA domain-containing protein